jgi:hypothetical protein
VAHSHHTVITQSSHSHHTVITQSSHSHHTVITQSSHSHHTVITRSSHSHHTVITQSSHSHHTVIAQSSHSRVHTTLLTGSPATPAGDGLRDANTNCSFHVLPSAAALDNSCEDDHLVTHHERCSSIFEAAGTSFMSWVVSSCWLSCHVLARFGVIQQKSINLSQI